MITKDLTEELVFSHYKLPLKKIEVGSGFGYYGALLMGRKREKMQCHVCGDMFANVGAHIRTHRMSVSQYREKYEIAKKTALVSEVERDRLKARSIEILKKMSPETRARYIEGFKKAQQHSGNTARKITLETKNKRGTCPDQLIERIKEVAEKLGRAPSLKEFNGYYKNMKYYAAIVRTFGSWNKGVRKAGFTPVGDTPIVYSDLELLDFLRNFYENNKKLPTRTDLKRGLLPSINTYQKRFGGMMKAREMAGLPSTGLEHFYASHYKN